ncbi:MAG: SH3 domain-containing protein [Spirochaetia bacterium]
MFLTSCQRRLGYGVVLWSPDEVMVSTGTVVRIRGKSVRREVYRLTVDGRYFDLPVGRIKVFRSRRGALEYAQEFSPYIRNFVEVKQRQSLPVRTRPDANAAKIYNFPANRTAKVLSRSKNREEIPPYKGYWYKILTEDGVQGYVYGRYLSEFLLTDTGDTVYDEKDYFGDAAFESLFEEGVTWRPSYYKDMIDSGHIVLSLFNPEYGLFLKPEQKRIEILTRETPAAIFIYEKVMPTGPGRYFFYDESVTLTVGDTLTTVFYPYENRIHRVDFVPMDSDLSPHIQKEIDRREKEYKKFMALGEDLSSQWGRIRFTGDGAFMMTPSDFLSALGYVHIGDGRTGQVSFDIHLGGEMSSKYDGALTLNFRESKKVLPFLYAFTPDGVRLTLINNVPAGRVIRDEFAAGGLGDSVEYRRY